MKSFLILFSFIVLLSCSYSPKQPSSAKNISETHDDSNRVKYIKLIDGVKHNYVLYYRNIKATGGDLSMLGIPDSDSAFKLDSIKYSEGCRDFFNQEGDFINWLLSFKYDTTKSGLWVMYHNPLSSYLSECNLPNLNNSRAAIILLENFLVGDGFECFECEYDDRQKCSFEKYNKIETFLLANKDKSITELRTAWQIKNDR